MANELQFYSDTTGLTIEARIFMRDELLATVECTEGDNLVYLGNMPEGLTLGEYAVMFFSGTELEGVGTIVWDGADELNFQTIRTGGGGGVIDMTRGHDEIISKYEKLLLKKLSELLKELPKTDISPLTLALSSIKPVDITDVVTGLGAMNTQIAGFSRTMKEFYEKEKKDIETKYANEIDKKNSLLAENEYNLQKKQSEIDEMSKNVKELSEEIEEIKKNNEAELKEVENAYLNKIEIVKIAKEEEIVEKIIPLLTP